MNEENASGSVVSVTGNEKGDVDKVLEMVIAQAEELVPKIIENIARTMNKSSFGIRVEAGYNKEDELVVKVSGAANLPTESTEMAGEILEGRLRLW